MSTSAIERGDIYFFYRPKVDVDKPKNLDDIQRLYLALFPDEASKCRLFIVGKKKLPDIISGKADPDERHWMMIETVASPTRIRDALKPVEYDTETRGKQQISQAIPAGEGRYAIFERHDSTRLAYRLTTPDEPGKAQQELGIRAEASYILSVRNPDVNVPGFPDEKPDYPKDLKKKFADERWIDVSDPRLLNYEKVQCLLIGAHDNLEHAEIKITGQADLYGKLKLDESKWPRISRNLIEPTAETESREPRRDPSRGGKRGGRAALESASAAAIAKALKGIDFPRKRSELVDYARKHNASDDIVEVLEDLPANKFRTMSDVQQALSEVR